MAITITTDEVLKQQVGEIEINTNKQIEAIKQELSNTINNIIREDTQHSFSQTLRDTITAALDDTKARIDAIVYQSEQDKQYALQQAATQIKDEAAAAATTLENSI